MEYDNAIYNQSRGIFNVSSCSAGGFCGSWLTGSFWALREGHLGKANFYHFIHAIGLLLIAILSKVSALGEVESARIAGIMLAGVVVFSGTLYLLALTGYRPLGMITPIGGTLMIIAWGMLFFKSV